MWLKKAADIKNTVQPGPENIQEPRDFSQAPDVSLPRYQKEVADALNAVYAPQIPIKPEDVAEDGTVVFTSSEYGYRTPVKKYMTYVEWQNEADKRPVTVTLPEQPQQVYTETPKKPSTYVDTGEN